MLQSQFHNPQVLNNGPLQYVPSEFQQKKHQLKMKQQNQLAKVLSEQSLYQPSLKSSIYEKFSNKFGDEADDHDSLMQLRKHQSEIRIRHQKGVKSMDYSSFPQAVEKKIQSQVVVPHATAIENLSDKNPSNSRNLMPVADKKNSKTTWADPSQKGQATTPTSARTKENAPTEVP